MTTNSKLLALSPNRRPTSFGFQFFVRLLVSVFFPDDYVLLHSFALLQSDLPLLSVFFFLRFGSLLSISLYCLRWSYDDPYRLYLCYQPKCLS